MSECIHPNCNRTIDPRTDWPQMVGYARPRSQRGGQSGSSLVARRATGRYLCHECAIKVTNGVDPGQEGML